MSNFGDYRLNNEHNFGPEGISGQVETERSSLDRNVIDVSQNILHSKENDASKTQIVNGQKYSYSTKELTETNNLSPEEQDAQMIEEEENLKALLEQISAKRNEINNWGQA
jgi:hypothetical protein